MECEGEISVPEDVMVGEILSCPDCGSDYEVASVQSNTVTFKAAEAIKEDWGE